MAPLPSLYLRKSFELVGTEDFVTPTVVFFRSVIIFSTAKEVKFANKSLSPAVILNISAAALKCSLESNSVTDDGSLPSPI